MLDKCVLHAMYKRSSSSLRFFKMLGSDADRAWYGADHVELAASRGAVGALLISDALFRQVAALSWDLISPATFAGRATLCSADGS